MWQGSTPISRSKKRPLCRAPTQGSLLGFGDEESNRATAPQCRGEQSCGLFASPREADISRSGKLPMSYSGMGSFAYYASKKF